MVCERLPIPNRTTNLFVLQLENKNFKLKLFSFMAIRFKNVYVLIFLSFLELSH